MRLSRRVGASAALLPLFMLSLTGCSPGTPYAADFAFPKPLALPPSATLALADKASDPDDPVLSRQQVVDLSDASARTLLDFYRQSYPTSKGWIDLPVSGDQDLCLVNRSNDDYIETLEVFPYTGDRIPAQKGRFLVMNSRFADDDDETGPCGAALAWVESDLL